MLTIADMDPNTQPPAQPADVPRAFSGWEAAAHWNQATLDWMAHGFQQWLALMTTVPPHFLAPPVLLHKAEAPLADRGERALATDDAAPRSKRADARPAARAEPQRSARVKAAAQPQRKKARARG